MISNYCCSQIEILTEMVDLNIMGHVGQCYEFILLLSVLKNSVESKAPV